MGREQASGRRTTSRGPGAEPLASDANCTSTRAPWGDRSMCRFASLAVVDFHAQSLSVISYSVHSQNYLSLLQTLFALGIALVIYSK